MSELRLALRIALEQRDALEARNQDLDLEVEGLRVRCYYLEDAAEMWREAALAVESGEASHRALGLTKAGEVLVIATGDEAAAEPIFGAA